MARAHVLADSTIKISIDTSKALIAREAVHLGARMINDVTAGLLDPSIFAVAAEFNVPMILMHMNGDPSVMQEAPVYTDVVKQVRNHLQERVAAARAAGVSTVYVDPGIGFGKTLEHNLELLKNLDALADLADGIVLGISRKRFLGTITGIENPADRDTVTAFMHALLWNSGVHMIRVHDVPIHALLRSLATRLA
ncbi:MAG: dihydropteroate synthase [Candidatus Kapabacteria bacterium]|nr:dihydropteroate synthase [Candidatus Kapabacteria bacterium]